MLLYSKHCITCGLADSFACKGIDCLEHSDGLAIQPLKCFSFVRFYLKLKAVASSIATTYYFVKCMHLFNLILHRICLCYQKDSLLRKMTNFFLKLLVFYFIFDVIGIEIL